MRLFFSALAIYLSLLSTVEAVSIGVEEFNGSARGLKGAKDNKRRGGKGGKRGKNGKNGKNGAVECEDMNFNRIATFAICKQLDATCNTDTETVAEIVTATEDGMTLVYTDSEQENIGFVDISDPANPAAFGTVALSGEPTSVAVLGGLALAAVNTSEDFVNTSGELVAIDIATRVIVKTWQLGGQPDSVAVSPDGKYILVAIENERDEDLGDGVPPQMPAGFVVLVETAPDVNDWTSSVISLTGLPGVLYPQDPEPEFVAINKKNIAVVTLQENNAILLIDLATKTVSSSFTAGTVDLINIDIEEEDLIHMSASLNDVPREPDGVTFMGNRYFATADEGDLEGGSRGFTIFDARTGEIAFTSGSSMDQIAAAVGHYPEDRSGNKGVEPENVAFGTFDGVDYLFVNAERANLVYVYDVSKRMKPVFKQVLPTTVGPEGSKAIPERNLLVVAGEVDARGDKIRSAISIYEYSCADAQYPTLVSKISNKVTNFFLKIPK
mmetsp:Transcript_47959/g.72547  ORF Transcript_47959/g.72547 Transcript_47959/m.72547 type:complete len:497 (-) Transcript_47959:1079-2569(-)